MPDDPTLAAPPRPTTFFLVKFLSKYQHVESLLDGKLYAQRLALFKRIEGAAAECGRLDRDEGTSSWMQPGKVHLEINGWDMTSDLAGPVQWQPGWLDHLNVFCVHAGHTGDLDLERLEGGDVESLRRQLLIPKRCLRLGEHAVVITDPCEFRRRFGAAVAANRYRAWEHLVRYYDPSSFHGHFDGIDPVFMKQSRYSYQREYRFAIWTGTIGEDPLTLEIGDIRDITLRFRSAELNTEYLGGSMSLSRPISAHAVADDPAGSV